MTDALDIIAPERVGLSAARLRRMDDHFRSAYVDTGKVPGILTLVARRGAVAHLSVAGMADRERGVAMRDDALVRIYSMTKPLTSVLFMMLVEEGKVALDDPVCGLIPKWRDLGVYQSGAAGAFKSRPPERPMLMIDLLRHTSGLTYAFQERTPVDAAYAKAGIGTLGAHDLNLVGAIEALAAIPLDFSPGSAWNYSVSTDVLGYLIGVIERRPFEDVLRDRLLEPLGMTDTGFQVPAAEASRLAACYLAQPGGQATLTDDPVKSAYLRAPRLVSGGGGLISTAADYLRFCRMLLAGGTLDGARYLSRKTVALMTANHLPGGGDLTEMSVSMFSEAAYAGVGFGLGFAIVEHPARMMAPGTAGSYFWGGAAGTYFWIDPAEELIVIFMTQLRDSSLFPLRRDLRNMVYAAFDD